MSVEDCDDHLRPAIESIAPLAGLRVLDVGAGTGRLTRILAAAGATVVAVDREPSMLAVARARGASFTAAADAVSLPLRENNVDLGCAGWVFGHFPHWSARTWREEAGRAIAEMRRVVRPGGRLILLETLGIAVESPTPPSAELVEYYRWLEDDHGFERRVLRTDFQFASAENAVELCGFFFEEEVVARVRALGQTRVPEFTGMWWQTVDE